jgi:dihydrofolate reductase
MRNLIYSINLTIDGCLDHTNMTPDEELFDFFINLVREAGTLAYGRITYQLMVPYWPDVIKDTSSSKADLEFARAFDAAEKVVFSKSMEEVEDKNSRLVRTDPAEEILRMKQRPGKDILVGGVALPSYLIEHGLVDEYIFVVYPIIVGKGKRLMEGTSLHEKFRLRLVDSKILKSGSVLLHYVKHPG